MASTTQASTGGGRKALVTGGAGFIGHHLVRALLGRGYRVRVLDDFSSGRPARLDPMRQHVELIQGSILNAADVAEAVGGVEVVFHAAAWVSVPGSIKQPAEYHEANATGTLRVLLAARDAGVRRFVYASSSSAYGDDPELPKRESMRGVPISPYAVSKYAGELYATVFAQAFGLETISLRYFNVFGPHQDPKSLYGAAIPNIVSRMLRGERPDVYGDGEQTRDFCHVNNVVHANLLAAEHPGKLAGEVVNVACGQRVTVNDIIRLTNGFLGTKIEPNYHPPRLGDVRDSWADVSLAKRVIGYEPVVYFEEGLRRSVEWYRENLTNA